MSYRRVIVLAGPTPGLGRALIPVFVQAGHVVAGCGRSAGHVMELWREFGDPHRFAAVDVTDAAAVEAWAREVLAELGPPDLLINNAAVMNPLAPLWAIPAADFDRV